MLCAITASLQNLFATSSLSPSIGSIFLMRICGHRWYYLAYLTQYWKFDPVAMKNGTNQVQMIVSLNSVLCTLPNTVHQRSSLSYQRHPCALVIRFIHYDVDCLSFCDHETFVATDATNKLASVYCKNDISRNQLSNHIESYSHGMFCLISGVINTLRPMQNGRHSTVDISSALSWTKSFQF